MVHYSIFNVETEPSNSPLFFVCNLNAHRKLILLVEFEIDLMVVHRVQLEHAVFPRILLSRVQSRH